MCGFSLKLIKIIWPFSIIKEDTGTFCHDALITWLSFFIIMKTTIIKTNISSSHCLTLFTGNVFEYIALFIYILSPWSLAFSFLFVTVCFHVKIFWYTKLNINNSNFSLKQCWLGREYDNKDLFVWLCIPLLTFCCDVITGEPDRLVVYEDRLVVWGRDFMGRVLHLHAAGIRGKRRLVSTVQGSQLPPTCQDPKPAA